MDVYALHSSSQGRVRTPVFEFGRNGFSVFKLVRMNVVLWMDEAL